MSKSEEEFYEQYLFNQKWDKISEVICLVAVIVFIGLLILALVIGTF